MKKALIFSSTSAALALFYSTPAMASNCLADYISNMGACNGVSSCEAAAGLIYSQCIAEENGEPPCFNEEECRGNQGG